MEVILNVYNLHESNSALHSIGLGFYHTGVEVRNYEYSFSEGGISRTSPRLPEFGELREQISMGVYNGSLNEITNILQALGAPGCQFAPGNYNLTTLNCNHFSDAFCMLLVDKHIPDWINRMAGIGAGLVPPNKNVNKKTDSGAALPAPGKVSNPIDIRPVNTDNKLSSSMSSSSSASDSGSWSIFNWFSGNNSSSSSSSSSAPTTSPTTKASSSNASTTASKPSVPGAKKELTAKQKEMLENMKKNKS